MMRTNSAAKAGTKYVSATDGGVDVGVVVAIGRSYAMAVSAVELKYELVPLNVAMIVYVPVPAVSMLWSAKKAYWPFVSECVSPR